MVLKDCVDIKADIQDIPILDDVFLAFQAQLALGAASAIPPSVVRSL